MTEEHAEFGILARSTGGPEVLQWTPLHAAMPGPGEVHIAQHAIGVNFLGTYYCHSTSLAKRSADSRQRSCGRHPGG